MTDQEHIKELERIVALLTRKLNLKHALIERLLEAPPCKCKLSIDYQQVMDKEVPNESNT